MNTNPPREFDPTEELARLNDPDQERFGLSDKTWFFTIISCRAVESFSEPAFTIDAVFGPPGLTPAGCAVRFVVRTQAFMLDVGPQRVRLFASAADEPDSDAGRRLVFDGDSGNPSAWDGALQAIGRCERFGVWIDHAGTLRRMWTEWGIEQNRRREERGF